MGNLVNSARICYAMSFINNTITCNSLNKIYKGIAHFWGLTYHLQQTTRHTTNLNKLRHHTQFEIWSLLMNLDRCIVVIPKTKIVKPTLNSCVKFSFRLCYRLPCTSLHTLRLISDYYATRNYVFERKCRLYELEKLVPLGECWVSLEISIPSPLSSRYCNRSIIENMLSNNRKIISWK